MDERQFRLWARALYYVGLLVFIVGVICFLWYAYQRRLFVLPF
jgi:hypothetical protein